MTGISNISLSAPHTSI